MADRPLLTVRHLTKYYDPKRRGAERLKANDDLNLTVRAGEIVALLGPNGAGKSTLLRQLAGQLEPSEGSIDVAGVDMVAHPRHAKRFLSAVPQECQPLDNLTVEEHVRFFGLIKGLPWSSADAAVEGILRRTGLSSERTKLARELSGGFKRRVLIAVALAGADAPLLLLDEPTTGLDPEARRSVWSVIETLRGEGKGILLTTHYIDEADRLADRVVVIVGGRFVLEGPVRAVRGSLSYAGRLEVREPGRLSVVQRRTLEELKERFPVAYERPHVIRFEVTDPFALATVNELARLAELGIPASLAPVSLEDVYLRAVGGTEEEP
ncbi:MAG TPA: ABC transporter ATP-binding protein [Thermoplasmata archaeon]